MMGKEEVQQEEGGPATTTASDADDQDLFGTSSPVDALPPASPSSLPPAPATAAAMTDSRLRLWLGPFFLLASVLLFSGMYPCR